MKYFDKNGNEWSIKKGDWIGSFDRITEKKSSRTGIKKFLIPLFIVVLLILFYGFINNY